MKKPKPPSQAELNADAARSVEEWMAELEKSAKNDVGLTRREIQEVVGHSTNWVCTLLLKAKAAGRLEIGKAMRESLDGRSVPVPVYRFITPKRRKPITLR